MEQRTRAQMDKEKEHRKRRWKKNPQIKERKL